MCKLSRFFYKKSEHKYDIIILADTIKEIYAIQYGSQKIIAKIDVPPLCYFDVNAVSDDKDFIEFFKDSKFFILCSSIDQNADGTILKAWSTGSSAMRIR